MGKDSKLNVNFLMVSGMVGILLLALIFDLIIAGMVDRNTEMGTIDTTLVWILPLLQMLFMVALIGLLWLIISSGGYSRFICALFLLVGLFLLYANPILYTNELPESWYVIMLYLSPYSMMAQAGGALAAFGLVSLFFWHGEKQEQLEEAADE